MRQSDWQQEVNYQIQVRLDDSKHELQAHLSLVYTNNSPDTLEFLFMHLWPNAYSNDQTAFAKQKRENGDRSFQYSTPDQRGGIKGLQFRVNGTDVRWKLHSTFKDIARVELNSPLLPGKSLTLETPFQLDIPEVFSRLGHDGQDYFMTQWYPKPAVYDVNGWNAMPYLDQGEFYSEFGSFDVTIQIPENYVVAATGEVQGQEEPEFWKQRMQEPVEWGDSVPESSEVYKDVRFLADNVHDFAWFASKNFNVLERGVQLPDPDFFPFRLVTARVFAKYPQAEQLDAIEKALRHYSDKVGFYPYPHATAVSGRLRAGGGMEYPMITVCSGLSEDVVVHEVGHNWFYGILANNERRYPWMDESVNSYMESDALRDSASDINQSFIEAFVTSYRAYGEYPSMDLSADLYPWNTYGIVIYSEGARAFTYLRQYLGSDRFDGAMRAYYQKWKFKHPLPGDMQDVFESQCKEDLDWFFQGVLGRSSGPDFGLYTENDQVHVFNDGAFSAPVPVTTSENGIETTRWIMVQAGSSTPVGPIATFENVWLDRERMGFDPNRSNNSLHKKWKHGFFGGFAKVGGRHLYSMPLAAWNHYDGWMLGYGIHNWSINHQGLYFDLFPMYGFKSKELTGHAGFGYQHPTGGMGAFMRYGVQLKRFSWQVSDKDLTPYAYTKIRHQVTHRFARPSLRSSRRDELSLSYHSILFDPQFDEEQLRLESQNPRLGFNDQWNFLVLSYSHKQGDKLNGMRILAELEQGMIRSRTLLSERRIDSVAQDTSFPLLGTEYSTAYHTKLSATVDLKLDIGIKNKPMEIRMFWSYFFAPPSSGIFMHNIGYTGYSSMISDYRMDQYVMHRHASEGLFRNQISSVGSQSRFVMVVDQAREKTQLPEGDLRRNPWVLNAIVTVPLPGKIPLKPYVEVMAYSGMDRSNNWNTKKSGAMYNVGIEWRLIRGVCSIYFNLAQSADLSTWQQENLLRKVNSFGERITFSLTLPEPRREAAESFLRF